MHKGCPAMHCVWVIMNKCVRPISKQDGWEPVHDVKIDDFFALLFKFLCHNLISIVYTWFVLALLESLP